MKTLHSLKQRFGLTGRTAVVAGPYLAALNEAVPVLLLDLDAVEQLFTVEGAGFLDGESFEAWHVVIVAFGPSDCRSHRAMTAGRGSNAEINGGSSFGMMLCTSSRAGSMACWTTC